MSATYRPSMYALTWDALRIFREEMRRFVVDNLQQHFGDLWMAMGVEKHFKLEQIDELRRLLGQRSKAGQVVSVASENLEDMLDLNHFRQIVEGNWSQVFRPVLGDRAVLDQWIAEVTAARNPLAHWAGGEMRRRDALRVVDTCERVVRSINPQRADELLAIWQAVDTSGHDEAPNAHRATLVFDDGRQPIRATVLFDDGLDRESPNAVVRAREDHPHAYEPWSPEEEAKLLDLVRVGAGVSSMAAALGRQPSAIRSRLARLGIHEDGAQSAGEA